IFYTCLRGAVCFFCHAPSVTLDARLVGEAWPPRFLTKLVFFAVCFFGGIVKTAVAQTRQFEKDFLYGASVYPELQTREEWNRMLDEFRDAGINCVRVSESSWGNLETAPGKYNFGWLHQFLDDLNMRGMKAVLGTSSYLPPQWLTAANP